MNESLLATKGQAAYLELRSRVLRGEFPPGAVLNQEEVAADFGLSTTPLREALQRLQAEGLVLLRAHHEVTVAPLTEREISELSSVRLQLDPYAGWLAAQYATATQIEAVTQFVPHLDILDSAAQVAENRRFHRSIYLASGNRVLSEILDSLWDRSDRYRLILVADRQPDSWHEFSHAAIAAALAQRDQATVLALLRGHVETAHVSLLRRFATD